MKSKKIFILLVSMLMLLCLGLIYGWSIFVKPLEQEFGWDRSQTSLTFSISMAMFCIGGIVGGQLTQRKMKRTPLLIAAGVLLLAGFMAVSTSSQLSHFYIYYGVICGFAVGICYNVLISAVTMLFTAKQGLISGLLMMSFGFGGLILGSLCSTLIESMGWRSTFQIVGVIIGLIVVMGSLITQLVEGSIKEDADVHKNDETANRLTNSKDYLTRDMLKQPIFYIFALWLVLVSSSGLLILGHVAPAIFDLGVSPSIAAMAVGLVSVFNGIGRVSYGILYDRIGLVKTLWFISSCLLLGGLILSYAVVVQNIPLFFIGAAATGAGYGGSPISTSVVTNKLFGSKFFSGNFSLATSNLIIAALIGPTLAANLHEATGAYQTSFYALVIIAIITLITNFFLTREVNYWTMKG